ncbi:MAG: EamA family transporter [Mizugakiibacter sp.]|uniref:EamA family transporter n=1 Tax=Mizugakiibacter sp. TaxID=1972610 RepID=UPI0031C06483|nr:EamA family transporter [Xanthomonadaceae bacterium]
MPTTTLILWFANIVIDTVGQLAFKSAARGPDAGGGWRAHWRALAGRRALWLGIGCFVAEFVVWLAFLSLVPLSSGVLLGSINIVAVMLAGRLLFGERLSARRVAGILLIAGGVAVVGAGA